MDAKERRRLRAEYLRKIRSSVVTSTSTSSSLLCGHYVVPNDYYASHEDGTYLVARVAERDSEEDETSKKDQRKIRNRLSAIESRKRKSETVTYLSSRVGEVFV